MNIPSVLWNKFRKGKRYREEFVSAQVKKLVPLQIRRLLKQHGISQETLAERAGLTQGVVSRAANPEYGNLTLNTLVRIAAGFDIAFIGRFVPFSELDHWLKDFSEDSLCVKVFTDEDEELQFHSAAMGKEAPRQPVSASYFANLANGLKSGVVAAAAKASNPQSPNNSGGTQAALDFVAGTGTGEATGGASGAFTQLPVSPPASPMQNPQPAEMVPGRSHRRLGTMKTRWRRAKSITPKKRAMAA